MTLLCAISGEAPRVPVVSRKSGSVYERQLIEAYILENQSEPTTGEPLSTDDLLDIRNSQSVRPRPPTLTSIPALLGVFQQEWDALALETYNLQQNLAQTRQELSTALYQHDAAVRVIAKLARERDEARDALSKIRVEAPSADRSGVNGNAMQVDSAPLPPAIIERIENTQASLMKTRRKRPVPEEWATGEAIATYKASKSVETPYSGARFVAFDRARESLLLGGSEKSAGIYSSSQDRITGVLESDNDVVVSGVWTEHGEVVATASGAVNLFSQGVTTASFHSHAAAVTGLTLHPGGQILASVSSDKTYVLYDLEAAKVLTQVASDSELLCTQFHPDGHLLAAGTASGKIQVFDVKSGAIGGTFDVGRPVCAIEFSENGTWLAAAAEGSVVVSIWDLRKAGTDSGPIHELEADGQIGSLDWDYTAQFLLVAGMGGLAVHQYTKATKQWSQPLRITGSVRAAAWGQAAAKIAAIDEAGVLTFLS